MRQVQPTNRWHRGACDKGQKSLQLGLVHIVQQGPEPADVRVLGGAVLVEGVGMPVLQADAALPSQQLIQDLGSGVPVENCTFR